MKKKNSLSNTLSTLGKKRWLNVSKEERREAMSKLARLRWKGHIKK